MQKIFTNILIVLLSAKVMLTPFLIMWGLLSFSLSVEVVISIVYILHFNNQFSRFYKWYRSEFFKAKIRKKEYEDFVKTKRKTENYDL